MNIPTNMITPSPTNPRRHFDESAIAGLARSIKAQGIIHPPIVRMVGEGYELVTGERRWRAAQVAKLEEIPCDVRDMSDEAVIEMQIVENLQREDLTPLEEAAGYLGLVENRGYTEKKVADRIGRARGYVHARISLCSLCDAAEEAFRQGEILLGHANCLCRFQEAEQLYLLGRIEEMGLDVEGLKGVIASELIRILGGAPWDTKTCADCLKRTGAQKDLFGSMEVADGCLDPECWERNMAEFIESTVAGLRLSSIRRKTKAGVLGFSEWAQVHEDDDPPSKEKGIIVDGQLRGSVIDVCVDPEWVAEKRAPKVVEGDDGGEINIGNLDLKGAKDVEALWLDLVLPKLGSRTVFQACETIGIEPEKVGEWAEREMMEFKVAVLVLKGVDTTDLEKSWLLDS